jgi:hypothetical protein
MLRAAYDQKAQAFDDPAINKSFDASAGVAA